MTIYISRPSAEKSFNPVAPSWGLFLMKNWNIFNHWEFSKSFFFINVFVKVSRILKLYSRLMIPSLVLDVSHIVTVLGSCGPTWWHMQPVRGDPQPLSFPVSGQIFSDNHFQFDNFQLRTFSLSVCYSHFMFWQSFCICSNKIITSFN